MNALLRLCAFALVVLGGSNLFAQSIPPELAGVYTGKVQTVMYGSTPPLKEKGTVLIQIYPDSTAEMTLSLPGGSPTTIPGEGIYGPPNHLFMKFPNSPNTAFSGRLAVKGKAGKQSLKGTQAFSVNGFYGVADFKIKVKRLPL